MDSRRWWLVISISILVIIVIALDDIEDTADVEHSSSLPSVPLVSVIQIIPSTQQALMHSYGEVKPHWQVTVKSQVSGEVLALNPQLTVGNNVTKDTPLIDIENSRYQANLFQSELGLAEARLQLLQAEHEAAQAKKDWQQSGIRRTATALALRQPQQKIAEHRVKVALSQVNAAQITLDQTHIESPFSGIITQRFVSPGEVVNEGTPLFHIVDDQQIDIAITLSKAQWTSLPHDWKTITAQLLDLSNNPIGTAELIRGGDYLDSETRQYPLILRVTHTENTSLLAGDFINVQIQGKNIEDALVIPASALAQDGNVWYLDASDTLRHFSASVLFYRHDKVIIKTPTLPNATPTWRIATTPLASFIAGNTVEAQIVDTQHTAYVERDQ